MIRFVLQNRFRHLYERPAHSMRALPSRFTISPPPTRVRTIASMRSAGISVSIGMPHAGVANERNHVVAMAAKYESADILNGYVQLLRDEGAIAGRIQYAGLADDAVLGKSECVVCHIGHGIHRVAQNDDRGVRCVTLHILAYGFHDPCIGIHEVIAAHARLAATPAVMITISELAHLHSWMYRLCCCQILERDLLRAYPALYLLSGSQARDIQRPHHPILLSKHQGGSRTCEASTYYRNLLRVIATMNLLLTGFNDFVCELGAFHFRSAIHQAGEVIRYGFVVDGRFHAFVDQVSRFLPSEVLKDNAGEDNGTRVYYVFVCIFRSGTMSRFENCMSCYIVDVSTRSDTDTPTATNASDR